jgi:dTDP-glucose 4,6-dehydratase
VNLGNPREMTILEFAEAIRQVSGNGADIVYKPLPQDDPKRRQPDITRAKTLLQWQPEVVLEDGLRLTLEYFRKRLRVGAA